MISIPVSFLLAALFLGLAFAVLAWRSLPRLSRFMFAGLFLLMAIEASLVGMRFAYSFFELLAVQRILPVWVAPGVYLAFRSLTEESAPFRRRAGFHAVVAFCVTIAMMVPVPVRGYVDALIAISYMVYTLALIRLLLEGADCFSQAPTALADRLRKLLVIAIFAMVGTLFVDVWIALLFAQARQDAAAEAVSLASLLFLAIAVALVILSLRKRRAKPKERDSAVAEDEDSALVETARRLLSEQDLFRDSSLTLTRLARRAGVPDRDLSRAVNAVTGGNVSQFVNQVRLEEAARLLASTNDPIARIQEQVGFLTRSNFYREFQKVHGVPPGTFRKNAHSAA